MATGRLQESKFHGPLSGCEFEARTVTSRPIAGRKCEAANGRYVAVPFNNPGLSYYRKRVENVADLKDSPYAGLNEVRELREGGRYELRIKELNAVFGGSWASFRMWRIDVDEEVELRLLNSGLD